MPKFDKYDTSSPANSDIFIVKQGSDTKTYTFADIKAAVNDLDIEDHATDTVLVEGDMGKMHRFTGAAANTLPEITSGMIGKSIFFAKRTTSDVSFTCSGSDKIVEAGTTVLTNDNAAEIWANVELYAEALTTWQIKEQLGTWNGS